MAQPDGVRITGVGAELPPDVVTSAEVEERLGVVRAGLEAGWLERVTGVRERRWASPDVMPSALAAAAGRQALAHAGLDPLAVDALLYTGITRDFIEPGTSNVVQEALGAWNARVFDVTNGCNGLIDGLDVARFVKASCPSTRVIMLTGGSTRGGSPLPWQGQVDLVLGKPPRLAQLREALQNLAGAPPARMPGPMP